MVLQPSETCKTLHLFGETVAVWLEARRTAAGTFPGRSFYGEAFAGLLWHYLGKDTLAAVAYDAAEQKIATEPDAAAHVEFIRYAQYLSTGTVPKGVPLLRAIRHKPTNWILLRLLLAVQAPSSYLKRAFVSIAACLLVRVNQLRSGQLLDRRVGRMLLRDRREEYRSDQYHAFMLVLLSDFYECAPIGKQCFKKLFFRGTAYLVQQRNLLQSGRGKRQLFGYAATAYALAYAYRQSPEEQYLLKLEEVLATLTRFFQTTDAPFPLALVEEDEGRYWESYNNLFDYLPFAGALLLRTSRICSTEGTGGVEIYG